MSLTGHYKCRCSPHRGEVADVVLDGRQRVFQRRQNLRVIRVLEVVDVVVHCSVLLCLMNGKAPAERAGAFTSRAGRLPSCYGLASAVILCAALQSAGCIALSSPHTPRCAIKASASACSSDKSSVMKAYAMPPQTMYSLMLVS